VLRGRVKEKKKGGVDSSPGKANKGRGKGETFKAFSYGIPQGRRLGRAGDRNYSSYARSNPIADVYDESGPRAISNAGQKTGKFSSAAIMIATQESTVQKGRDLDENYRLRILPPTDGYEKNGTDAPLKTNSNNGHGFRRMMDSE